jgi:hypothetical protein
LRQHWKQSSPCRAGEPSKADIVVNPGTMGAQCLINGGLGMHDFHIHRLKSEWKCGYDGWSLHQPSNDRSRSVIRGFQQETCSTSL